MKRIGLIDVDGGKTFPSIPLMKISAWHKAHGDEVEWYSAWYGYDYDRVYMSKVFSFTPDFADSILADEVIRGGSGYAISLVDGREIYDKSKDPELPQEIEHIYPDYSIYPRLTKDTAYGFMTRGCPRGCDFCHVAAKEGRCSRKVADISEFWNGQKNIVLSDPNVLACPDVGEVMRQLQTTGAAIDFNQGLDARLLTRENISMLKRLRLKEVHFAWDKYGDREKVLPKLEMFAEEMGRVKMRHNFVVYTLVNFNTTFDQDLERIYTLRSMGYWPYVMIYDKEHSSEEYKRLARWVNNRFIFASCPDFKNYNDR